MMKALTPPQIHPPFSTYSHGIETPPGARLVALSGQLGIAADGSIPADVEGQTDLCLLNIDAILAEAGISRPHVVRLNAYVTDREALPGYMAARNRWIEGLSPPPASTLMIVSGFARPEFRVEIEALAAVL